MFDYYMCLRDDGFLNLTDIDFSGSHGTAVVGRNSVDDGYEIQLQIEYDYVGYTITILKQPGGITAYELSDGSISTGDDDIDSDISSNSSGGSESESSANNNSNIEPESNGGNSSPSDNGGSVSSGSEPENTESNGGSGDNGAANAATGILTEDIFRIIDAGEYHMKLNMTASGGDGDEDFDVTFSFEMEYDIYAKDGMSAMVMEFFGTMRTVCRDGKTYTIFDDFKSMSISDGIYDDATETVVGSGQLIYIGEGSEEFSSKTLKYDEYSDINGTVYRYYVDGGVLKGIRTINSDGSITDMEILLFENIAPDSIFEIPTDYETEE